MRSPYAQYCITIIKACQQVFLCYSILAMEWLEKHWGLVVIVVLTVALVIGGYEKRCQAQAYQCRADYTAKAQIEAVSKTLSVNEQAAEQEAIATACEPNGYFCRLFSAANLPTMLLFLIGGLGIIAALQTLKAIEKQADAMINSERAWLIAELIPLYRRYGSDAAPRWCKMLEGRPVEISDLDILNDEHLKHVLKITNMGRTPAQIIGVQINYSCLGMGVNNLPNEPFINSATARAYDYLLGAGGSVELTELILDVGWYMEGSIDDINKKKRTAIFHGWVKYKNVFSDQPENAKFASIYNESRWSLDKIGQPKPATEEEGEQIAN